MDEKIKLIQKYNFTLEQLDFDVEEMSLEDLENKLIEISESDSDKEKFTKTFELSHEDIRQSLYQLLYPVEDEDNDWYFIDAVFQDKFEYEGLFNGKIYRQSYSVDNDNISFTGDRIELFQERLTTDEKAALDEMRANYAQLKSDFESYKEQYKTSEVEVEELRTFRSTKLEEERSEAEEAIFTQFNEKLNNNEEYETLKENAKDYSLDALSDKCFAILGKTQLNFSLSNTKSNKIKISVDNVTTDDDPYGGIREKYLNKLN